MCRPEPMLAFIQDQYVKSLYYRLSFLDRDWNMEKNISYLKMSTIEHFVIRGFTTHTCTQSWLIEVLSLKATQNSRHFSELCNLLLWSFMIYRKTVLYLTSIRDKYNRTVSGSACVLLIVSCHIEIKLGIKLKLKRA